MAGPDRMLRQATAALAQGALLHSTRELLVARWEFLSLQGQEPVYEATGFAYDTLTDRIRTQLHTASQALQELVAFLWQTPDDVALGLRIPLDLSLIHI
eukprot:7074694-Prorocentrum_lima.AAC.1